MVDFSRAGNRLRQNAPNGALFLLALVLSVYQAFSYTDLTSNRVVQAGATRIAADVVPETGPDGARWLRDFGGEPVALKHYTRIASASTIADEVLVRLVEPDRVVAFTARSADNPAESYRYQAHAKIDSTESIERILALRPDLVIVNTLGNEARKQRLMAAGIPVFDLGAMRGMQTLLPNILSLGLLIGHPERAERLAGELAARMARIAQHLAPAERRHALYVGIHGTKLYGGTRGSSYEDVLAGAGLVDVAAAEFEGWPSYTPEQLLRLDPELIITQSNTGATLCRHTELSRLRVCSGQGRLVEVDPLILGSPGIDMVVAAEQIHDAVYGSPLVATKRPPAGSP